ncbi:MAG: undecaprenyl-diphosphate phosphatase [Actinomycetota bacterium]
MTTGLAVLLGVVQGVTEFLPISSKTHLVVVPALLGETPPSLAFITLLHLGTLVALVAYFARDLVRILIELPRRGSEGRKLSGLLLLATIPAGVMGVLFEETFERLLSHPREAAFALLATAFLLVFAEWAAGTFRRSRRLPRPLGTEVGTRNAIAIGIAQAVALLPGVSRSGSTMSTGLALGIRRDSVARFSFLLAIPAIAGANVLEFGDVTRGGLGAPEIAGFLASLVTGYLSVALLIRYLRRFTYLPFAAYCLVFAIAAGLALS